MARLSLKTILMSGMALVVAWVFISKAIVPWVYLPRDTAKSRVNTYESRVDKLEALKVLTENDEHYLAATSRNAFSMDKSEAISRMGVYLTETIKASGLSEDKFTRRPLKATQLAKNGATQIGYTVSGQGSLPKVIDLMFLLEQTPFLPRSTIKSYTQQGGRLTLVTVKPHSFEKGQMVQLNGAFPVSREFPSSYNGVFRVINTDTNPAPMTLTLALPNAGKNTPTATKSLTSNSISANRKKKRNWLTRLFLGDDSKIEPGLAGITKIKGTKQTGNRLTIYTKGNHLFNTGDKVSLQNLTPSSLNKTGEITRDSAAKFSLLLYDEAGAYASATTSRVIPQRVENITMLPVDGGGEVRIDFQFLSLIVGPTKYTKQEPLKARVVQGETLGSEDRTLFAAITQRAFFLPYQKKPAPLPTPTATPPSAPTPPGPETYKIVSLSEWKGQQEIMVLDSNQNKTASYKPGDELAGGKIVMIDYRKMPFPKKPALLSQSRVILIIGEDYWAIERGNTLADKHKLVPEQLPENLAKR